MDPVSTSLVLAGVRQTLNSAAGEAGQQAWQGFVGLVRRAFNRPDAVVEPAQAEPLAAAVAGAAQLDPELAAELRSWLESADRLGRADNSVHVTMSGHNVGPVIQAGRIYGGVTYH